MSEDAARPAVLHGFADIECPRGSILQTIKQDAILAPWNLCSKLLHNFTVRPGLGESAHVFEVASGVTRELRKFALKIGGQAIDHLGAPAFPFLASQDIASDFPIMQDKLGIGCECGLDLCCRLVHNCLRHTFPIHTRKTYRSEISPVRASPPSQ